MIGLPDMQAISAEQLAEMPRSQQLELVEALDAYEAGLARDDFALYCRRTIPNFKATPAHLELCRKLEGVARGDTRNLGVSWPVRHGKTLLCGRRFTLWWMSRNPGLDAMFATHTVDLANKTGQALRRLAQDAAHLQIFPEARLREDTARQDSWELTTGGSFRAAGQGSAIVGFGWNLGICDDLIRGLEAASSALQRESVWDWYTADFLSRMQDPSCQIFTSARWHDADPMGKIIQLTEDGRADWDIYHRPALGPNDEPLAPELVPVKQLLEQRAQTPARIWQAMWQGDPVSESGDLFRADWFQPSDRHWMPADGRSSALRIYGASDIAASESSGDFTVHAVYGIDTKGVLHIIALWRGQATPADWIEKWIGLARDWRPQYWTFGSGLAYRMVEPALRRAMLDTGVFVRLNTVSERGDKPERAQAFSAHMENGRVRWNMDAPWYAQAHAELTRFPAGATDDVADTMSLIGLTIDRLSSGQGPAPPPPLEPLFTTAPGPVPEGFRRCTWAEVRDSHMEHRKRERRRSGATMEDLTTWPK